jgi:hypothetical protein
MPKKYESKRKIEELTEAEIYAAIRYLEPGLNELGPKDQNQQEDYVAFVLCGIFLIVMGCLGFVLFYS